MHKAFNAYMETAAVTTSQGEVLIMLYDGAIKFLTRAKAKIEERDYAEKGILLSRAIDIINELDSSLNAQKGGELADNLHKLYFYCNTRILNANMKLDNSYVDEVIRILSGLRDAYKQIIQGAAPKPGNASRPPANAPAQVPPLSDNKAINQIKPESANASPASAPQVYAQKQPGSEQIKSTAGQTPGEPQSAYTPMKGQAPTKSGTNKPGQTQADQKPDLKNTAAVAQAAAQQGPAEEQKAKAAPTLFSKALSGANAYRQMASQQAQVQK